MSVNNRTELSVKDSNINRKAHGAMIALHPLIGGLNSWDACTAVKFVVNSESSFCPIQSRDQISDLISSISLTVTRVP